MDMEKTNVEERATLKVAKPNKDEETLGLNVVSAKLSPVPEHPNREDNIDSSSKETDSKSAPSVLVTNFETGEILVEGREHSNLSAQRSDLVSNLGSSYDTSKRTGISESQMETSSNLKRRFEVSPGTASRIKPLREILADLDSDSDKNVVENTTEQSTFTDAATSMGFDYLKFSKDLQSRSQATTSEDIRPVHGVRISEESSISSLDVSHGISSISLSDSVDSGHKIPLVESPPPKRKITSPDFSEDPDIPSKMVRISLEIEEISSKSTHVISKELHRKRAHSVIEEKDFLKYSPDINASAKVDTDAASAYSGSETTDKDPIIEFPADSEDSSKSERSSLKRTYVMPPDSVEDITDISLDVKRKKETE